MNILSIASDNILCGVNTFANAAQENSDMAVAMVAIAALGMLVFSNAQKIMGSKDPLDMLRRLVDQEVYGCDSCDCVTISLEKSRLLKA